MEQAPEQAGGEEAVVETLIGGQHRRVVRLFLGVAKRLQTDRLGPEEHLEDQEIDVQRGDQRHQRIGDPAHVFPRPYRLSGGRYHVPRENCETRPGKSSMPAIFHLDRLKTPIGIALLVTDEDGALRALDWEEYEARMRELLRLQCGAVELKDARAPAA